MNSKYQKKTTLMMENYKTLRKSFKWDQDLSKHLIALSYAVKDKSVDIEDIRETKDYIKNNTGAFSPFRGTMMFAIAGILASGKGDPKEKIDRMIGNLKSFKSVGFKSSMYLPTALYTMETLEVKGDIESFLEKSAALYKDMRKNHPFLTSGDDYALAILLADSGHDADLLEEYYTALAGSGFYKGNGLQMMSHIMAFGSGDVRKSVEDCADILDRMKAERLKVTSDYYPALALISLLEGDSRILANELVDVVTYLKGQKHYKWLGKGMNTLLASAIITSEFIDNQSDVMSTALTVSIEAIIAAQQAAMIAAISASTAASAAAN